jgi:hypothetical protein
MVLDYVCANGGPSVCMPLLPTWTRECVASRVRFLHCAAGIVGRDPEQLRWFGHRRGFGGQEVDVMEGARRFDALKNIPA